MKPYKLCLLSLAAACAIEIAQAQVPSGTATANPDGANGRLMREASSETGSLIKKETRWSSKIPLNKTYEQLTPEQKADLNAMYASMAPGDEPPFPLEGMKPIFGAIKKAQSMLKAKGELNMAVTVGPDGKATKVEDFGTVNNPEMVQFAGSILLMTKFKPAVCAGKPCTMQFPFNLKLSGG